MASIEAYERLIVGGDLWQRYVEASASPIDLTFVELNDVDLSGRSFRNCNFTGAKMVGVNLDKSSLDDVMLDGAELRNASLVGCELYRVSANRSVIGNVVIRNSSLAEVSFSGVQANYLNLDSSTLENCQLEGAEFRGTTFSKVRITRSALNGITAHGLHLEGLQLNDCVLDGWNLEESHLKLCILKQCMISEFHLQDGTFERSKLNDCTIHGFRTNGTVVSGLDLSRSSLIRSEIASIGPSTAVLVGASLVDCDWPPQSGRVTWLGRYIPSSNLIVHPVQDINGLSPFIRREVADAQYLTSRTNLLNGRRQHFLFRAWGATSAYGQSLSRLAVLSLLVVLFHTFALLACRGQLVGTSPDLALFWNSFGKVFLAFLGLGEAAPKYSGWWNQAIMVSARGCGLFSLGMWIGIAAKNLARLAGEW